MIGKIHTKWKGRNKYKLHHLKEGEETERMMVKPNSSMCKQRGEIKGSL